MNVYAISDLHMSGNSDKPMNVFGANWENHMSKIIESWNSLVADDDAVIIAGDISWAMRLEDGVEDLKLLAPLKGKKIFCRGNHDYWWSGITRLRALSPDKSFIFLQNDCVKIENVIFAGTRGWMCPGSTDFAESDRKIYEREAVRFSLAFDAANSVRAEGDKLIAVMHYPPFNLKKEPTLFTELFEKNRADKVVFGHIHGSIYFPFYTELNGIEYYLTSCDKMGFKLVKIL